MSHYYDDYYPSPTYYSTASSSPSSSSSSSLSRIRQHLSSHTQQRATKASDLACLLDPSYTTASHNTTHTARHIYVDHDGEAHDPDFRLFNYSPRRKEFLSLGGNGMVGDEEDVDETEESSGRRASMESYYRPMSRMSDPTYYSTGKKYSHSTYGYDSSPYAYAVEDGYASPEEVDEIPVPTSPSKKKLRRRRASHGDEMEPQMQETESEIVSSPTEPHSPTTCDYSYTFRRSWAAFRLRTQVAAYRARKRMLGMVHVASPRRSTI